MKAGSIDLIFLSPILLFGSVLCAQDSSEYRRPAAAVQNGELSGLDRPGPLKDASFEIIWLIESNDANRRAYAGPAAEGLIKAGFGRMVPAGSARCSLTIGQKATLTGTSRFGTLNVFVLMLNTTVHNEVQVHVELMTKTKSPIQLNTQVRVPLDRWFLLGAADSRVGLPLHEADGKRAAMLMKITNGVLLLD